MKKTDEELITKNDVKIAVMENNMTHVMATLLDINKEIKEIRSDLKEYRKESLTHFRWLLSIIIISILVPLAPTMQKIFHIG